jgi:hypothetical protein
MKSGSPVCGRECVPDPKSHNLNKSSLPVSGKGAFEAMSRDGGLTQ